MITLGTVGGALGGKPVTIYDNVGNVVFTLKNSRDIAKFLQLSDVQAAAGKKSRFTINPDQGRALTSCNIQKAEKYFTNILGKDLVEAMSADTWAGFAHLYYAKPNNWKSLGSEPIKSKLLADLKANNGILTESTRAYVVANTPDIWVHLDTHFNHHRGVTMDLSYYLLYSSSASRQN